jgi:ApaG protein
MIIFPKVKCPKIVISVEIEYLPDESDLINQQHVFIYTITITNEGQLAARLLGRHWVITDSDGNTQEIKGDNIVGEQPQVQPGENYQYSSYAIMNTPIGSMVGCYQMISENGQLFHAEVPTFLLADPLLIN